MRGALLGLAALGAGVLPAGGPSMAAQPTMTGLPQENPGDALSRNLKTLAANPKSVDALTGAGRAALAVGDAQAALGFLARAEEESPRDGRIKMWIASALVQLEQPHAALKFFKDAAELGVPEAELARDRGLAYDIVGDQRRAQRDYRLALQQGRDPEIVRRLALSLAIGGDREQALRLLDDQLAVRTPAAERTRALVLALTGDMADAGRAVQASLPGPQGEALMPFLARLPGLSPADRALAVHLGHFPQGARTASPPASAYAMNDVRANVAPSRAPTEAGRPDPSQPALGRTTADLVRAAPASPSGDEAEAPPVRRIPAAQPAASAPTRAALRRSATVRSEPPELSLIRPPAPRVQVRRSETHSAGTAAGSPRTATRPASAEARPTTLALDIRHPSAAAATPALDIAPPVVDVPPPPAPGRSRLAQLAASVAALPAPVPAKRPAERAVARRTAPAAAAPASRNPAAVATKKPAARELARHWVQIGVGEDEDALPGEFGRLKAKAGKLLAARSAWTAPMGGTNRLLVGPFADGDDAQEFVNALAEKKLRAFVWTSPAGGKVAKLPAK
jgi:Flp pilus assembly protein TadD